VAGSRLDSAGSIKMKTLDDALLLLQRLNGLVEQYAMAVKNGQPSSTFLMTFRRTLPSLAANLKAQFGLIAEQVVALNLSASRGASEAVRVRTMREGMALLKQALEIAMVQTKARHTVTDEPQPTKGRDGEP
jgi:hypothetical protein